MTNSLLDKQYLKSVYKKLKSKWDGNIKTGEKASHYQKINSRFSNALNVIKDLSFDPTLNLLDIGSNNGLLSMVASCKFGTVTGVEFKDLYYKNSLKTKKFFKDEGFGVHDIQFKNSTLKSYSSKEDSKDINAVLACQVLYHLDDSNIDGLLSILPQVKIFICSARKDKNKTNNRFGLFSVKSISNFLEDNKFSIDNIYYEKTNWPVFVARKYDS